MLLKWSNLTEFQKITAMKISAVVGNCQVCDHQNKALWNPVVSCPLVTNFNALVCMDLHQLGPNLWYLHCICAFSRLSLAINVSSKVANVVIPKYIKCWVLLFGPRSRAILSNNWQGKIPGVCLILQLAGDIMLFTQTRSKKPLEITQRLI